MRRIKTYKKWSIWRLTAAEAIDVGGRFAAFLWRRTLPVQELSGRRTAQELIDFTDSYET